MAINILTNWKGLKTASKLGWQIESNWADPFVFAIYSVIKPIASSLILVFMYLVVTRGNTQNALFNYVFVGNTFYIYIGSILFGISWALLEDREHYEMLKFVYISPIKIYTYLVGRGAAMFVISTLAVIFNLLFGLFILKIPLHINWWLLFVYLIAGLSGVVALGIILAGIILVVPRHSGMINESVAGIFYLFCGVIFPIDTLPNWLIPISKVLPFTYWLEGMRRAVLGNSVSVLLSQYSNLTIFIILILSTLVFLFVSDKAFKLFEHRARSKGLIDRTTGY